MWTCVKCHQNVEEQYSVCPHCGAARSAGRFSRGIQPRQTPGAQYMPDHAPVRAGRGFMAFGTLLALLVPSAVVLLAIISRKHWVAGIYQFLYPEELGAELSNFKANLLYWFIAAAAVLAGILPGIWTIGMGKILRRLSRMEDKL